MNTARRIRNNLPTYLSPLTIAEELRVLAAEVHQRQMESGGNRKLEDWENDIERAADAIEQLDPADYAAGVEDFEDLPIGAKEQILEMACELAFSVLIEF